MLIALMIWRDLNQRQKWELKATFFIFSEFEPESNGNHSNCGFYPFFPFGDCQSYLHSKRWEWIKSTISCHRRSVMFFWRKMCAYVCGHAWLLPMWPASIRLAYWFLIIDNDSATQSTVHSIHRIHFHAAMPCSFSNDLIAKTDVDRSKRNAALSMRMGWLVVVTIRAAINLFSLSLQICVCAHCIPTLLVWRCSCRRVASAPSIF